MRSNRTTSRTRMNARYDAADIEVLSGVDPVKRRPGVYTDTTRPNHLAQEVVDNAVDEALAGHASEIDVVLHTDDSYEVSDDGRGIPGDTTHEAQSPGVVLIHTTPHPGRTLNTTKYNQTRVLPARRD